jgi:Na+/H+ antiporter NhaD/arsenite permease-like protein
MEEEVVALFLYSRFLSGYRYLQSLAKIKDTEEGMADSMEFGKASSYYEALAIFALVLALIILRRVRGRSFPIWTSMMLGAALTIVFGIVPITKAYEAIDFDVIFFLLGMFSIVAGMEKSGLLAYLTYRTLSSAKSLRSTLIIFVFMTGILSAFVVNDTMAVMGTPIAITLVKQMGLPLETILVVLAFSITIGSVMTPMGNPQNILIASESGVKAPFLSFLSILAIPTLLNLAFVAILALFVLKGHQTRLDGRQIAVIAEEKVKSPSLARLSAASLFLAVGGFILNDLLSILGLPHISHLGAIAFLASVPLYFLAEERRELLYSLDWSTIVFFISMFIVMEGLWHSGAADLILNFIPAPRPGDRVGSIVSLMLISLFLSQIFSNVPLVKLYVEVMKTLGFDGNHGYAWLALAAGSTIAGNLTVLGAASNVIIVEASENRTGKSFSYIYFLKLGLVMTSVNAFTYTLWLILFA